MSVSDLVFSEPKCLFCRVCDMFSLKEQMTLCLPPLTVALVMLSIKKSSVFLGYFDLPFISKMFG